MIPSGIIVLTNADYYNCLLLRIILKKMRAGNAGSGPLIRRRRREVALVDNLP
jgi:hypothetical protein